MAQGERVALVVHMIPGRLRLRLVGDRWDPADDVALAGSLDRLRATLGVREVQANPRTGSLLVRYDPERSTTEAVLDAIASSGIEMAAESTGDATLPRPQLDRRLLSTLAISGASLYGARQVGAVLGGLATWPAYFAIWFALRRLGDRAGWGRERPPGP